MFPNAGQSQQQTEKARSGPHRKTLNLAAFGCTCLDGRFFVMRGAEKFEHRELIGLSGLTVPADLDVILAPYAFCKWRGGHTMQQDRQRNSQ
jgi:hypothetical protein